MNLERFTATIEYLELVKKQVSAEYKEINNQTISELMIILLIFEKIGIIDLDRYPLAQKQIQEWIVAGKLPNLPQ